MIENGMGAVVALLAALVAIGWGAGYGAALVRVGVGSTDVPRPGAMLVGGVLVCAAAAAYAAVLARSGVAAGLF